MSGQSAGSSTSLTALRQLQGAETPGPAVLTDLAGSVTPSWIPRRRLSPTARGSTEPRPSLPKSPSAPPASPFGAAGSRRLAPADSPVTAAPRAPSLRQRTPAEPPAALPSREPSRLEKVHCRVGRDRVPERCSQLADDKKRTFCSTGGSRTLAPRGEKPGAAARFLVPEAGAWRAPVPASFLPILPGSLLRGACESVSARLRRPCKGTRTGFAR
jgi:hypothetical protein